MPLSAGDRLGRYEIVEPLGSGGMGEVYRAHDDRLGRDVAIKVLPEAVAQDRSRLKRFEREARATAALDHPNVLAIHDLGEHQGRLFISAELLEGDSLRQLLHGGPLPPETAVDYAIQVAEGIAAAHDKGIAHRDLKPENLFVTSHGRLKILDFGLAKLKYPDQEILSEGPTATLESLPGKMVGTVAYMAPEQVRGKPADHRSDIFSFGVVLYEMLSGMRPFRGDSSAETLAAILKEDPKPVSSVSSAVGPALDRLSRQVRRDLGETLYSVERRSEPLMQVTTASLEALREYSLGHHNLLRADFEKARPHFRKAVEIDPGFTAAKGNLGMLLLEVFADEEGKRWLAEAVADIDDLTDQERYSVLGFYAWRVEEDLEKSAEVWETLIAMYPDRHAPHNNLGRVYWHMGRYGEAMAELAEAIRLDPNVMLTYNSLNEVLLYHVGDVDEVIKWAGRQHAIDESQAWGHYYLCWAYLGKGDPQRALQSAIRAVELEPGRPEMRHCQGHAYRLAGRYEEADQAFREDYRLAPQDGWVHYQLGHVLRLAGHEAEARGQFEIFRDVTAKWIEESPGDINLELVRDHALLRLGLEPQTPITEDLLGSSDPELNLNLAKLYSLQGRHELAIDRLERAADNGLEYPVWNMVHPDFDSLVETRRFRALRRRTLGLDE